MVTINTQLNERTSRNIEDRFGKIARVASNPNHVLTFSHITHNEAASNILCGWNSCCNRAASIYNDATRARTGN
jgi:hypothetical protein